MDVILFHVVHIFRPREHNKRHGKRNQITTHGLFQINTSFSLLTLISVDSKTKTSRSVSVIHIALKFIYQISCVCFDFIQSCLWVVAIIKLLGGTQQSHEPFCSLNALQTTKKVTILKRKYVGIKSRLEYLLGKRLYGDSYTNGLSGKIAVLWAVKTKCMVKIYWHYE